MHDDYSVMHENLFAKSGLSLDRLKSFIEIVSAGSIAKAAQGDANRQSQFSRQLKELETFFGTELARRGRFGFALTPAGKRLYRIAQMHLASLAALEKECSNEPVEVHIGAGESLIHWLIVPVLPKIDQSLPEATFVLHNLKREEIIEGLQNGEVDLGFLRCDGIPKSLKSAKLMPFEYQAFVHRDSLNNANRNSRKSLFRDLRWAVLEGESRITRALNEAAEAAGTRLNIRLACSSFTQLAKAVRVLGLAAVIPRRAASEFKPEPIEALPLDFLTAQSTQLALAWNPTVSTIRPAVERAVKTWRNLRLS